jgi:hypothetical protein
MRRNMQVIYSQPARQPGVRYPRMARASYSCRVLFITVTISIQKQRLQLFSHHHCREG